MAEGKVLMGDVNNDDFGFIFLSDLSTPHPEELSLMRALTLEFS